MAKRKKQTRTPAASPEAIAPGRGRRSLLLALAGAAVFAVIGAVIAGVVVFSGGGSGANVANDGQKKAVIVDQLQLTQPDPEFISNARDTLSNAGYTVDYVAGNNVNVGTYRTRAEQNYDLIILRVHAGITIDKNQQTGQTTGTEYVSLFTNEPFDANKYPDELNKMGKATYPDGSGGFFGIGPEFIKSIPGNFGGATVILMSCDGLKSQVTAQAFLDHGASSFVSWSQQVSGPHTDQATDTLLKHMLIDGTPVQQAVQQTASEVGPDATYGGELRVITG